MSVSFHKTVTGDRELPWPRSAEVAAQAGFEAIDLDLWEVGDGPADAVAEALERVGICAGNNASLPVEFRGDEATFEADLEKLPRRAELAATVGVEVLSRSIPSSGQAPREELLPLLRRRLAECATILRAHGLRLAIETLGPLHLRRQAPYQLLFRLDEGAAFAQSCGEDVGLLVDAWHWHHAGDGGQSIADLGPLVFHVHVADAPDLPPEEIEDKKRLLPGEGVIDFGKFARGLDLAGYTRQVTPEVFGYPCHSTDPLVCASRVRESVQNVVVSPRAQLEQVPPPPPPAGFR